MHDCVLQYYLQVYVSTKQDTEHLSHFNPLRAKSFKAKKNIYLDFISFLHIHMAQVVEILPQVRQEHTFVPIPHGQYHGCWCAGDAGGQGISNHDIYYVEPN